jgi:hypothetical protein
MVLESELYMPVYKVYWKYTKTEMWGQSMKRGEK